MTGLEPDWDISREARAYVTLSLFLYIYIYIFVLLSKANRYAYHFQAPIVVLFDGLRLVCIHFPLDNILGVDNPAQWMNIHDNGNSAQTHPYAAPYSKPSVKAWI